MIVGGGDDDDDDDDDDDENGGEKGHPRNWRFETKLPLPAKMKSGPIHLG